MSVMAEVSLFPVDKGVSLSPWVARAVTIVKNSGLDYSLNPMGTVLEGEWDEVNAVISQCFKAIAAESERVYMTVKVDYRAGQGGRMQAKPRSVEDKMKA
ncbi:MTH1187 family thiamine-binding protein [Desulfobaculum sp. SPO524]|uniref:MTH1187 family thiamine-binding protein n=1 Tax=Desulfobaculum sp. SPO524 TaxID=3378071 RepID=UPI003853F8D2